MNINYKPHIASTQIYFPTPTKNNGVNKIEIYGAV